MKKFGKGKSKASPKMNVTPLVDVVLVLLIIFMVAIPSMENDVEVTLPTMLNVDADDEGSVEPVTVSMQNEAEEGAEADIHYYYEQSEVSAEELVEELTQIYDDHAGRPKPPVVIRADETLAYEHVRTFFGLVQSAGFGGAALRVSEAQEGGSTGDEGGG